MGLIFRLTRFREFGERGIEYRKEYFLESLGLRFHAGLCQYFFAAHKCQQYCGTHFPVFLELCLYLLVARDLVNFSWICNRCLIHFQLDKPLRESVRKRERDGEKMADGRLMLDSSDVYTRNKSRILSARNNLFFKIVSPGRYFENVSLWEEAQFFF